ncbi:MAG: hypothetical protein Q9222_004168 [Ikaeria aurantiellina]
MTETRRRIRQLSLGSSRRAGRIVTAEKADEASRQADFHAMQLSLHFLSPIWPHAFDVKACPHPLIVPASYLSRTKLVHKLLSSAITNIVERWWSDEQAQFPQRMPLQRDEEELLKWMNTLEDSRLPPYRKCQGSWKPDFLLDNTRPYAGFQICEINSRFPFNGFLHTAFSQQAYMEMEDSAKRLTRPAARPEKVIDGLISLFDPSVTLHLLKGEETGLDIHQLIEYLDSTTGKRPVLITPSDLRLLPNSECPTGFSLHAMTEVQANGDEKLEPIAQVGLELCQHELLSLSPALLGEISLRCFNDLRTVFLVHDKRMLGIVLQELPTLVNQYHLFSPAEAETLRQSIALTIIPGSEEMKAMLHFSERNPHIRSDYLLKPIRGGKGHGIIFGSDTTAEGWRCQLESLQQAQLVQGQASYVVQARVEQPRFDLLLNGSTKMQRNYLVGTYMAVHGEYLGLGFWRSSPNRISALSRGGDWVCTVTAAPVVAKL